MSIFLSEFLGSMFLILFGVGVVANVLLDKSKGQNAGWLTINFGWAMAVFIGIYISTSSGSHLNPAVTIAMAYLGRISTSDILPYLGGQLLGCFTGAVITWLLYIQHYDITEDKSTKLATFSTGPAIRNTVHNILSEVIGTFALVSCILFLPNTTTDLGHLNPLPVALIVLAVGISLGGPTGYAINPARDLGPRIAHFILPIKGKGDSDWQYSWIPIVGPILGALIAAIFYNILH
jgi:glycerol uptake facilitator protein